MVSNEIQAVCDFVNGNETRPLYKTNRDLWKRITIEARRIGAQNVNCVWTKGHADQESVDRGWITQADKDGNDSADELAVKGRKAHGDSDALKGEIIGAKKEKT